MVVVVVVVVVVLNAGSVVDSSSVAGFICTSSIGILPLQSQAGCCTTRINRGVVSARI